MLCGGGSVVSREALHERRPRHASPARAQRAHVRERSSQRTERGVCRSEDATTTTCAQVTVYPVFEGAARAASSMRPSVLFSVWRSPLKGKYPALMLCFPVAADKWTALPATNSPMPAQQQHRMNSHVAPPLPCSCGCRLSGWTQNPAACNWSATDLNGGAPPCTHIEFAPTLSLATCALWAGDLFLLHGRHDHPANDHRLLPIFGLPSAGHR